MYRKTFLIGLACLMGLFIIGLSPTLAQQRVNFADANLRAKIAETLGKPSNATITTADMLALTRLEAPNANIQDLRGLEHAHNLTTLNLGGEYITGEGWVNSNTISNFSPLNRLPQLTVLNLSLSSLTNVSFLSRLTQLRNLYLWNNSISNVSVLVRLKQLTYLGLDNNTITDVAPLAALTQLTSLQLSSNTISNVSAVARLTELRSLGLGGNVITDISPLAKLTQLTSLSLWNNDISDVSGLAGLTQLIYLYLSNNTIVDVAPLKGLTQLTYLDLRSNAILDVSPLKRLNLTGTQWQSTGLYLERNPLNYASINTHIPAMQARRIEIKFETRTPTTLVKLSGTAQQGTVNAALPLPFVVEVRDERNHTFAGVPVRFKVTAGSGRLSARTIRTDATGRAEVHLTLGRSTGTTTVGATAENISQSVEFTATAILLSSPVSIPDANLRAKIAKTLGKPHAGTLTAADMFKLTTLTANNANIRELTGLQYASNLQTLSLNNNNLSDVTLLAGLPQLRTVSLNDNSISDVAPLAGLPQLRTVSLDNNNLSDITPLAQLSQLRRVSLNDNNISDVASLEALRQLKTLHLRGNLLSYPSLHKHIRAIQAGGASVTFDSRRPTKIVNISGTRGVAGAALPFIVEVQDEKGFRFSGVPVAFKVMTGGGQLSAPNAITDATGRARTTFTLGAIPGKNVVRADAAEMSRPVRFTITTINASSFVSVPDANLRAKIVETLGKSRGAQLAVRDMLALTRLEAPNANIQDLTGLEYAYNLTVLNLEGEYISGEGTVNSNKVSNFSPLSGLTQLMSLNLSFSSLSDVSFLSGLTQLRNLYLWNNNISNVSALAGLKQLTYLGLDNNAITDVAPLSGLTQLTSLQLNSNTISDVSALAGLTQLRSLYLGNNAISDVSPLAGLTQLTSLTLWNNHIRDVSAFAGLTQLTSLHLSGNTIVDVAPLRGLTQLTLLDLRNNTILDVSPLIELNLTGTQWNSTGLYLERNPLSYASINTHIPNIRRKRVEVKHESRTPTTLIKILGDTQQGTVNAALPLPFVVEVLDQHNRPFAGVPVTFTVTTGRGRLSATTTATDAAGTGRSHLTLGRTTDTTIVRATAAEVSESVEFTATAILLSSPVSVPDANLRAKIAQTLGKPFGEVLTAADLLTLTKLTANNADIRNLTGLQYASNLTTLSLNNNNIFDIAPLAALTQLTRLSLNNNQLWNVVPLAALTELKRLSLRDNSILDVSPLVDLTQLKGVANGDELELEGNPLNDVSLHTHIPALQAAGMDVRFDSVLTQPEAIVRLVYFHPRDREPQPDIDAKLDRLIKDVQQAYAGIMEGHGFGRKTFTFETDANGNTVVRHVVGRYTDEHYSNLSHTWDIWGEIDESFEASKNIYLTAIDISTQALDVGEACGRGGSRGASGGQALILASGHCFNINVTAHELGHALGLQHDYRGDAKRILSTNTQDEMVTSFCAAEWLDVHRAFNSGQPISNEWPTIEMLPPSFASLPNAIHLRFEVADPDGLHQAQLHTSVYGRNS